MLCSIALSRAVVGKVIKDEVHGYISLTVLSDVTNNVDEWTLRERCCLLLKRCQPRTISLVRDVLIILHSLSSKQISHKFLVLSLYPSPCSWPFLHYICTLQGNSRKHYRQSRSDSHGSVFFITKSSFWECHGKMLHTISGLSNC